MGLIVDELGQLDEGPKIYPKDIINHMVLVWATKYIAHSPTAYNDGSNPDKPCDVVVVDVVDLDQLDESGQLGLLARGSWWRQGRLIQRLRPRVGRPNPLLGRIGKGVGPNGAFELVDLSADPKALGRANAWWENNQDFTPTTYDEAPPQVPQQVSAQTVPVPEPSPLENRANAALGRLHDTQAAGIDRLRQMGSRLNSQGEPPF